ncbi:MAG: hypothetical protein BWY42_00092 [Candidatus Omnitrophica bacterium ADurb.Bin277]|nr:MAG: hypothetical protein BWY42_00092 [Candidatus Omnitrophica bacterium ADurb.Bin277]
MDIQPQKTLKMADFYDWGAAFFILFAMTLNLLWFVTDNHADVLHS